VSNGDAKISDRENCQDGGAGALKDAVPPATFCAKGGAMAGARHRVPAGNLVSFTAQESEGFTAGARRKN